MLILYCVISVGCWKSEVHWDSKENKILSSFGYLRYLLGGSGIWMEEWRWGYHREDYGEGGALNHLWRKKRRIYQKEGIGYLCGAELLCIIMINHRNICQAFIIKIFSRRIHQVLLPVNSCWCILFRIFNDRGNFFFFFKEMKAIKWNSLKDWFMCDILKLSNAITPGKLSL